MHQMLQSQQKTILTENWFILLVLQLKIKYLLGIPGALAVPHTFPLAFPVRQPIQHAAVGFRQRAHSDLTYGLSGLTFVI
jgi:hypothetical protein